MEVPVWVLSLVLGIVSALVGWSSYNQARIKDQKNEAIQHGSMMTELKNINKTMDSMDNTVKAQTKQFQEYGERLAVAESSIKSAHHRIDEIANKVK